MLRLQEAMLELWNPICTTKFVADPTVETYFWPHTCFCSVCVYIDGSPAIVILVLVITLVVVLLVVVVVVAVLLFLFSVYIDGSPRFLIVVIVILLVVVVIFFVILVVIVIVVLILLVVVHYHACHKTHPCQINVEANCIEENLKLQNHD